MALEMERDVLVAFLQAIVNQKGEKPPTDKAFANIEAAIEYSGSKIVLPADPRHMTLPEARDWLSRLEASNEEVIAIHEVIDAHPWDGCVAFMQAMKETYGWASPSPTRGFFGMRNPPQMVSIDTAYNETATIFWGGFRLPNIDGQLETGTEEKRGQVKFVIQGSARRKHMEVIHGLAELTRKIVRERSIYRGKALNLALSGGYLDMSEPPTFMNLKRIKENELVFSEELEDQIITNLWTPIEHTQYCRDNDVPLKRGVLLEGPFGTGKSLAASVTAKKCEQNGWTFITVGRASALDGALQFAMGYQPCVVFIEDIDRETEGDRTVAMDELLNKVDGIVSKNAEIMVVLTSNAAEKINQAMIRPGRLDAILHIGPPDAAAVQKLLRVYGRKLIKPSEDLSGAGEALAGRIPAVIREAVERSKLYAIARAPGAEFTLTDADIVRSAKGMKRHLELLDGPRQVVDETPGAKIASGIAGIVKEHISNEDIRSINDRLHDLAEEVQIIRNNVA